MPSLPCRVSLKKRLEETGAIERFREGRPDRFPLQGVQAVVNDLLKIWGNGQIEQHKIDRILGNELNQLKDELNTHEVAVIACCRVMSYDRVREQLKSVRPSSELPGLMQLRVKAWVQCMFQCERARDDLFTKVERAAIIQLLHAVLPARPKKFPNIWKLLRAIGDGRVRELFPMAFVREALTYSEYWSRLSDELEMLQTSRRWWTLVKGMHRAAESHKDIGELLGHSLKDYTMWASWNPNTELINDWASPILASRREKLALVLDLEGPDTTGGQHGTARGACLSQCDSVHSRVLRAASCAIQFGEEGVKCLTEFCTSIDGFTERNVGILEAILELGIPARFAEAEILFHFPQEYISNQSVNSRITMLVSVLHATDGSQNLQRLFKSALLDHLHKALTDAQNICIDQLQKGDPSDRMALGIIKLARALISATWLSHRMSNEYAEMLRQIPPEGEVTKALDRISHSEGIERQKDVDFLIEKLCAGPRAINGVGNGSLDVVEPEDPIWTVPMDLERERLRQILAKIDWIDKVTATACIKTAQSENDNFVLSLCTMIGVDTDQVCVNLAGCLGRLARKSGSLDPCWETLLLCMMRARPKGLLDRLSESLSLQSWQSWLNCLQHIFGDGYLDPDGRLGFTKVKIRQLTTRKLSLGRAVSAASTATRSTGNSSPTSEPANHRWSLPRADSLYELETPLTIPALQESDDQPDAFFEASDYQHALDHRVQTATFTETSISSDGRIPWYEKQNELMNLRGFCVGLEGHLQSAGAVIDENENIHN
ncbi:hypothetical protein F5Y01DRAFT_327771 [Xylaria sp. FL0043]|nr:hypothetical protein F5Y01DRAFT_327771 [Xylaria sp. FL0043]